MVYQNKMFYNPSHFPHIKKLESLWKEFLIEYSSLKDGILPYIEHDLYTGKWDVFPFIFFGEKVEEGCKLCPKTWKAIKDIPGLLTASFSILRAGTEIFPHTGFTDKVIRCHLGLKIPTDCAIIVGEESRGWQEGKCLLFDDTVLHSAYNKSNEDRIVLLLDIERNKQITEIQ